MVMRRFTSSFNCQFCRCGSYAAGLFNFKIVPDEMFPYPTRKLDGEESENLQSVLESIRKNKNVLGNLYGARIAAEYGGLGLGHTAHALVYEELGNNCDENLLNTIFHSGFCTHLIASAGANNIKGKYLTGMSDGSITMRWAIEEDECGIDISMNTTEAVLNEDGTYKLTGKKRCFDAASGSHFVVIAKAMTQTTATEGVVMARRSSLFICAKDTPGLKIEGDYVVMENVEASDVLGVIGEGFKDVMITLFTEQYLYAISLLGVMKRVIQELQNETIDQLHADVAKSCACTVYSIESVIYALTANMDAPTEDSLLECTLVTAFVQEVVGDFLRLIEFLTTPQEKLDRCLKQARNILTLMESQDFLNATAVCCGVEDYGLFFQEASTLQMMQARTLRFFGMRDRVPIRDIPEAALIDKAVVKFSEAVEATFVRNCSQVPYQQLILNRLGEAASLLYAASAVASRASACAMKGLQTAKVEKQLASAIIRYATERSNALSEETCNIGTTADDVYKRIALDLCEDALK